MLAKVLPFGGSDHWPIQLELEGFDSPKNRPFRFENVWLTQNAMAELFDTTKQNISLHIKNIFEENELNQSWLLLLVDTPKNSKQIHFE